jgi:4-hydroxy-4-methyl-2-oxoglutarate aldolase
VTDYRIGSMPAQLPADLVAKLKQVETATVGHWRHWGFMDRAIQPLLKGKRVVGTAVTVAIPGPDSTLLHHALGLLRPGDILVVDRLGDNRHACWGGGVTVAAKSAGAVAGIVDGPCTDQLEIEQSDFPLWSRGLAPITTRLYNLGGILNGLISCGGVPVQPGDAILADESGVLVLPPGEVDQIATAAIARQERGKANEQKVGAGAKLGDLSGATKMVTEALGKST